MDGTILGNCPLPDLVEKDIDVEHHNEVGDSSTAQQIAPLSMSSLTTDLCPCSVE